MAAAEAIGGGDGAQGEPTMNDLRQSGVDHNVDYRAMLKWDEEQQKELADASMVLWRLSAVLAVGLYAFR